MVLYCIRSTKPPHHNLIFKGSKSSPKRSTPRHTTIVLATTSGPIPQNETLPVLYINSYVICMSVDISMQILS